MDVEDRLEAFDGGVTALLIPLGAIVGVILVRRAARLYQQALRQFGIGVSACGLTGEQAASRLLAASGLRDVAVVGSGGRDLYRAKQREVQLTTAHYAGRSVAALATAAHEVGHAQQYAANRSLYGLRLGCSVVYQAVAATALVLLLVAAFVPLRSVGWAVFGLSAVAVVLNAGVTLPLESDASRRAREVVQKAGLLAEGEKAGFDRLLNAAWLTYAAAEARRGLGLLMIAFLLVAWPLDPVLINGPALANPPLGAGPPIGLLPALLINTARMIPLIVVGPILRQRFRSGRRQEPSPAQRAAGWNNAAMASYVAGDFDAAVRDLDTAIAISPGESLVYFNRASAYMRLCQSDRALADLDRALSLSPNLPEAYRIRGNLWLDKHDYDRALADFHSAIQQAPTVAAAWRDRGLTYLWRGDYEPALADLDEAIRLDSTDAVAFNNRGVVHMKRGDTAQASADLREAIRLDPELPNPRQHLATLEAACLAS